MNTSTITIPDTADGEIYAGILIKNGARSHHLILLPGDNDEGSHQDQLVWAKSIGGDLPSRREQSLLFANAAEHFEADWYWSNEQHASNSGCAWFQYFYYGGQGYDHESARLRARAVRRVPIE